ncbi:hypothetical protein F5880DRAFT_1619768 [Lentinula raphanica]|nr:hypothetical protein F5880DRAFT_1619768 [Lentinula raphanica]
MGYFLRSSTLKVKPTLVKPLQPALPFDFLQLIRAGISSASSEAFKEDEVDSISVSDEADPSKSTPPSVRERSESVMKDKAPLESGPAFPHPSKRKTRNKSNAKRSKKRRTMESPGPSTRTLSQVLSHGVAIEVDLDAARFDFAKGAHTGKPGTAAKLGSEAEIRKEYDIQELLALGFEHIAWDGK